jgi:Mn2+/Fe2+ NRAMP family transporter
MNKILALALGIVTSVGGFLEVGSLATSAQAGAAFGFQLSWAVVLGTACLIFLVEMSGRLAAVSRHTICDAVRERFGATFFVIPLVVLALVTLLVLGAEIGGVCLALQLATGIGIQWWALPVAFAVWLLLWKATFGVIENGVSLLGLVTVAFVVGALMLKPSWGDVGRGLLPSLPTREASQYWLLAVGILGASITPYLFYFYSSGAVEDEWGEDDLGTNRMVAIVGMSFGALLAVAVLVVAGLVFHPRGIRIERYDQMALMLTEPLGFWGFVLFVLSLGIACFGAALEVSLALAYLVAQGFGWNWGENVRPRKAARFATVYTAALLLGGLLTAVGVDPLRLTVVAMVLTAATLPLAVVPFLIVMNDEHYVGEHVNGWLGNSVVLAVTALACVLAIVSLPLQIFGG